MHYAIRLAASSTSLKLLSILTWHGNNCYILKGLHPMVSTLFRNPSWTRPLLCNSSLLQDFAQEGEIKGGQRYIKCRENQLPGGGGGGGGAKHPWIPLK